MTLEKFEKLLGFHDWTYAFSDDYRYYTKGREQAARISDQLKLHPEWMPLYRLFSDQYMGKTQLSAADFSTILNNLKNDLKQE